MQVSSIFQNLRAVQILSFVFALLIAYLLTPLIQSRALRLGLLDKPSKRKLHSTPVPRLGGVSIYVSLFLTTLFFLAAYWKYNAYFIGTFTLIGIFAGGTIIFFLGLLDDIEPLHAMLKLGIQIFAATIGWFLGIRILHLSNPFYHADLSFFSFSIGDQVIHFGPLLGYLLTVIWITGITNAINLLDGMDGLATGVCLISAIAIWAVSVDGKINQPGGALMAATLAGALLGFLRWNFNPARIFLGDSGAYLTGFVLASMAVSCVTKKVAVVIMTPVLFLIFALPIVDTLFAITRRITTRRSILEPDKGHLHHRILEFGFSQKTVSYLLYFVSLLGGFLATYFVSVRSTFRFLSLSLIVFVISLFYACIINWRHQKIFRNIFLKSK